MNEVLQQIADADRIMLNNTGLVRSRCLSEAFRAVQGVLQQCCAHAAATLVAGGAQQWNRILLCAKARVSAAERYQRTLHLNFFF